LNLKSLRAHAGSSAVGQRARIAIVTAASPTNAERLLARLLLEFLSERTGMAAEGLVDAEDGLLTATLAGVPLVIAVAPLASSAGTPDWQTRLAAFAQRLDPPPGGALVWLPPGAEPPAAEPDASETVAALDRALAMAAPGEAAEAWLPARVYLRKQQDEGAYVTAYGGLAPYWAQFTDRVDGYYQLDSKELHRLPENVDEIKALVERIVETARGMELDGLRAVAAEDAWRVRRLRTAAEVAVLGLPPDDESETGAPLRKRVRALLPETGSRLAAHGDALRLLLLYGHYGSLSNEPVSPALRGQEPQAFGGIDMIALAADGAVKPLMDITRRPALQARSANL
jgi:hypothetical protein